VETSSNYFKSAKLKIMNLIDKKYLLGSLFILLGVIYIYLSITQHKKDNRPNKIEVPDAVLKNMDIELKKLIAEDKKIEAIKKCRMITGFGLKEAKDYVDNLK
jgi:hypothetical protein